MSWQREESRPRITPDSRRAGLLTLVLGGLVVAGLLVMLVPTEHRFGSSGELACGTPLSAAFASVRDYVVEYSDEQAPPASGSAAEVLPPPSGLRAAAAGCVSDGRTRTSIGGALVVTALLGCAGVFVAVRRRHG